jgi:hypothetical protein
MNLFIKYLAFKIRDYPQITFSQKFELEIQDFCIKRLNVKDIGKLRDRLDGQSFLNNAIKKISSYYACIRYFNQLHDGRSFKQIIDSHQLLIEYNRISYKILVFNFGEIPIITEINFPIIFVVQKDNQKYSICGFADLGVLKDHSNYYTIRDQNHFIGFDKLQYITEGEHEKGIN